MSALAAVMEYEVRLLWRERAVVAPLILLVVLSGYAGWNGADWVQQRESSIELIEAKQRDDSASRRQFILQSYESIILPILRPVLRPGAMAPVSIGQADAYPFSAHAAPLGDYSDLFREVWSDIGNPVVRAAGRFDLAFVIVFLLPLVILVATYDLWSRERERGVATMVLSQPVRIGAVLCVKALTRGGTVLVPSVVIILVAAVWSGARQPMGLLVLAITVLAYSAFWLAIAVAINVVTNRSTESAIAVGAVWLLVVVITPSLTLAAIDLVSPAPSEIRFSTDLKSLKAEITGRQTANPENHAESPLRSAPKVPDRFRAVYAKHVALDKGIAPMIASHQRQKRTRREVLDNARFFLPAVAVQDALDRIAGSDANRALAFERQARALQLELRRIYKAHLDSDALVMAKDYDNAPSFQFRETGGVLQRGVLADLAALFCTTILIIIVARVLIDRAVVL